MKESEIKKISKFFSRKGLDIQGLGGKTIEKMYNNGLTTYTMILNATISDFKNANIGNVNSEKIWNNIRNKLQEPIDLYVIMGSSQMLGNCISQKTCQKIIEVYPNIISNTPVHIDENTINGLGQKTLDIFLKKLPTFKEFLNENTDIKIKVIDDKKPDGKFTGKIFE
jgi:NAD-dependent DNA ligase